MSETFFYQGVSLCCVNQDIKPLPHESILSSLWRFAWRNQLRGKFLLTHCKINPVYSSSKKVSFDDFSYEKFYNASGWQVGKAERLCRLSDPKYWNDGFRYCPICLEHGYHSYWHQSLYLEFCPLDGASLQTTCYTCGAALPKYGLRKSLVENPYSCALCSGPISGIQPSVKSRLLMQEQAKRIDRILSGLWHYWKKSNKTRLKLAILFMRLPFDTEVTCQYSFPYAKFVRNWMLEYSEANPPACFSSQRVPALVIIKWATRLRRPLSWPEKNLPILPGSHRYIERATSIYLATLRRLENLIKLNYSFSNEDVRMHLLIAASRCPGPLVNINIPLLAYCIMRVSLEPYITLEFGGSPILDLGNSGPHMSNRCWPRGRTCWRVAFIAAYADSYWYAMALCTTGLRPELIPSFFPSSLCQSEDVNSKCEVIGFNGYIAFPAIDGIPLTKSLLEDSSQRLSFQQRNY